MIQLIGIAGGTGSGKTTFVNKLINSLPKNAVSVISQDSYYKDCGHLSIEARKHLNFDHPDAIEWELLVNHLQLLKLGNTISQPLYSMLTCTREESIAKVSPNKVILVEGILVLSQQILRQELTLKVFIDADADHRLMRVVKRDIDERGRDVEQVMTRYLHTVKPMHDLYIEPTKKHADIIVPIGGSNDVAIELLTGYIRSKL